MTSVSSLSSSATASSTSTSSSDEIDWSGLIEEAVAARLAKADSVELRITQKQAKIAAIEEMRSLLADLVDAAQALRAPSGTIGAADDVFLARAGFLTANGAVNAEGSLGITVENGTRAEDYDIEIRQIAKAHKVVGAAFSSSSTDLGYSGVISLGTVGGQNVDIAIDGGMTLAEVAEAINYRSGTSGVQATVLKVAGSTYKLILSATATGQTISAGAVSGDDVLSSLGILGSGGVFADELQAAQYAIFTVDGVEITRDDNDIDDVVDGVTFNLYQETPDGTSITVAIEANLSAVKEGVQAFVEAYNNYRAFAIGQQTLTSSDDTTQSDDITQSPLFGDSTFRSINTAILDALNVTTGGLSLADIGLSFDESNYLEVDEDALNETLLNNVEAIERLLSFRATTSSSNLMLLERGRSAPSAFTLDITVGANGAMTAVSVNGNSSLFRISGSRIVGLPGTAYEGYAFVYAGDESASINVAVSTGLAEVLFNAGETAANDGHGTLRTLVDGMEGDVQGLEERSDRIAQSAAEFRARLTERYARIRAAIQEAEAVQSYLEAMLDAMYT
jgi:flagellar hook-associated protein 2